MTSPSAPTPRDPIDRRAALGKIGVGAGVVVGVVWTSPRIEGLSLRADYAQAASAAVMSDQTFPVDANFFSQNAKAGAPDPAPHLAYGYSAAPPLANDDPAPTDDGAGFARAPGSIGVAAAAFTTTSFAVTRSSDCPTTVDVTWANTGTPPNRTDNPVNGGTYPIGRSTVFGLSPARQPTFITFHFTC